MSRLRLESTTLPSIRRAMAQFSETNQTELGESLRRGMAFTKAKAQQLAPKKDRKLVGTIYVRTTKTSRGWQSVLGASARHARIREYGGTIRARRAPYLVFPGRNGRLVRVKEVRQKATPYLRPARRQTRADVVRELRAGQQRTLQKIVKGGR